MAQGVKTGGRQKGTPNKTTAFVKDAILAALNAAGGKGGAVAYLTQQAKDNPASFMSLVGRILPLQVGGDPDNPVQVVHTIQRTIIKPPAK